MGTNRKENGPCGNTSCPLDYNHLGPCEERTVKTPQTALELYLQMEEDRHRKGLLQAISSLEEFCETARKHIRNGHLPLHASGIKTTP